MTNRRELEGRVLDISGSRSGNDEGGSSGSAVSVVLLQLYFWNYTARNCAALLLL